MTESPHQLAPGQPPLPGEEGQRLDLDRGERPRHAPLGPAVAVWGPADRAAAQRGPRSLQRDGNLAGVRDAAVLAGLPAEERAACQRLWADVAALLAEAARGR